MVHVLVALFFLTVSTASAAATTSLASTTVVMPAAGDAVVSLTIDDANFPAATGLDLVVDGDIRSTVLVFGKVGHGPYSALLHELPAGRHDIVAQPSPYWAWPGSAPPLTLTASPAPESTVTARAPALWLRSDTIGVATDLPLAMYAEDTRVDGTGVVRYSVIFSNEDGGTATPALLARWGRTTDIEMAYEEEWRGGKLVSARYQAPDHHVIEYAGTRQGQHPSLVDATLNNVFLDRGRTAVRVTMVPIVADLQSATRESVMDRQPWIYRRMANELQEEGKAAVFGDVREYLYVDARLTLSGSAVAALARGVDGTWRSSDRGLKDLAVDRNGWVRIAIPQARNATDVGFQCYPLKPAAGTCRVEISRVLALDNNYKPGPDRGAGTLELETGQMQTIALKKY
jgi:hypothetical protein